MSSTIPCISCEKHQRWSSWVARAMMNTASKILQSKSSKVSLWPLDRPLFFHMPCTLLVPFLKSPSPQKPRQVRLTTLAKVNPSFQTAVMFHGNPGAIYSVTFLGLPQRNRQGFWIQKLCFTRTRDLYTRSTPKIKLCASFCHESVFRHLERNFFLLFVSPWNMRMWSSRFLLNSQKGFENHLVRDLVFDGLIWVSGQCSHSFQESYKHVSREDVCFSHFPEEMPAVECWLRVMSNLRNCSLKIWRSLEGLGSGLCQACAKTDSSGPPRTGTAANFQVIFIHLSPSGWYGGHNDVIFVLTLVSTIWQLDLNKTYHPFQTIIFQIWILKK